MLTLQTNLSKRAARSQAQQLAKARADWLRQKDRAELASLRQQVKDARKRRLEAMRQTVKMCRRERVRVREQVRALRQSVRDRINAEVAELRSRARNRCQGRKARINQAGGNVVSRSAAQLREERALQAQMRRLAADAHKKRARLSSAKERRQEDDDSVRSNLPPELVAVFDRVKKQIKGGPRTTRTEAFLEWAAENPGDVLEYQQHDADREVRRLVAEHQRVAGRLKKAHYRPPDSEVEQLRRMGLDASSTAARQRMTGTMAEWVPF